MGAKNVLIKGGHLEYDATDLLFDGEKITLLHSDRIETKNTHGTGCTLSSAIAANLAKGKSVEEAVETAKKYITVAIEHSLEIGKGVGPTNHFYELYNKAGIWDEVKD
ncbi:Hydroxymethylpyrimidine/phosphomethylpyrimidine kinase [bioreactor metagenome]